MPEIRKNTEKSRYEAVENGQVIGFAEFVDRGDHVVMPHTEVNPEHEGEGVGGQIAEFALNDLRRAGRKVQPSCAFIAGYIQKNPQYQELVQ
ncbi:N-acetyltransferase [Deinococcus cavernae]|uniref:N-acetyltransferase n=1 Tax=Deinococcus cavernae TaxID=2320857 RepID=A0A418UZZ4_9DEIO|nr:GNAT family N-acetyltransferase [Deinococcus cavernae]RJF69032.1 N-acetyltransferase [Deinococcus cavernae]